MNREEINALLGMSEEDLDREAAEYENGTWNKDMFGKPQSGRPPLYDSAMGTISFKEQKSKIQQINIRAAELKISRSDYMRRLVEKDLAALS